MKILTVIGARPQFIKAAVVSKALKGKGISEFLVHAGQHFDDNMSKVFFDEMGINELFRYSLLTNGIDHNDY